MNEGQIVSSVDPRISPPYNIAGSGHSRYNRKAYDRIMGPNTHYITVLRDPRSHIYSSFNYWSVPTHIQLNKGPAGLTPEEFIVDVPKYVRTQVGFWCLCPVLVSIFVVMTKVNVRAGIGRSFVKETWTFCTTTCAMIWVAVKTVGPVTGHIPQSTSRFAPGTNCHGSCLVVVFLHPVSYFADGVDRGYYYCI